ncbi:homeodomain-interacting protein kinase 4-like [Bombina bombina]|uniref:homeodomain-interacting protein kinase 4-like n=1 Tax=Bombina bombina TaxID=8345 RepID=UPI00235AEE9D|nr:homeodomain-interacting protein kinase 4-like [Bombina bombina]
MQRLSSKTDSYDILGFQGEGNFGTVLKCIKRSSGELVAIKTHKKNVRRWEVENELRMLTALTEVDSERCHIVRFYEYFYVFNKCCLAFEYMEQSLFEFQKKNSFSPLPIRHIRTISIQVLKALYKLKELSIIHTDLKPTNIMLVDQGIFPFRVKVIDFGSASKHNKVQNIKGSYIQTRYYRAPEVILGLPFSEKVDMWSLGCIMSELHLGRPLYPGRNEHEQISYICDTQGMPNSNLLTKGCKATNFFTRERNNNMDIIWQLKSMDQYQMETKGTPLKKRNFILQSLDQMALLNAPKAPYTNNEALAECEDLNHMVHLIKVMLTWDSQERISPLTAITHPYITLMEMKRKYTNTKYFQFCMQSLKDSFNKDESEQYSKWEENYDVQDHHDYCCGETKQNITSMDSHQQNISKKVNLSSGTSKNNSVAGKAHILVKDLPPSRKVSFI